MDEYYKILTPDMYSAERKNHHWTPGVWYSVEGAGTVKAGSWGFHGVKHPYAAWWRWGCSVWRLEQDGNINEFAGLGLRASSRARITELVPHPEWLNTIIDFVESVKNMPLGRPDNAPLAEWKVFPTRLEAFNASRPFIKDAGLVDIRDTLHEDAWEVRREAAWVAGLKVMRETIYKSLLTLKTPQNTGDQAVRDADLYLRALITEGFSDPEIFEYAQKRWQVWEKGYGCFGDVRGVLYVYERER